MVDSEAQERTAFVPRLPKAGRCLGTRLQVTIIDERMITLLSVYRGRNYLATASKLG